MVRGQGGTCSSRRMLWILMRPARVWRGEPLRARSKLVTNDSVRAVEKDARSFPYSSAFVIRRWVLRDKWWECWTFAANEIFPFS